MIRRVSLVTDEIWVLTDGRPGHISQTLGLAEALTAAPVVKVIGLRPPFRQLSPFLGWAGGRALSGKSARIKAPWPKLVITSGRSAIPIALAIRKAIRQDAASDDDDQGLSRHPVRKIHHSRIRHSAMKPAVNPRLAATPTSPRP